MKQIYTIENYGTKPVFASFLPGIAGLHGIPIWCYYVNRGQGVASFGVENKDHAIMEFEPAHKAYQNVKRTGFRTFLRKEEKTQEAFAQETQTQRMHIGMNTLAIEEEVPDLQLHVRVEYCILPEEPVGALFRKVTIENTAAHPAVIELLDGMPQVIPYGVSMESTKNMIQTAKAWMQVEQAQKNVPYFRVRASMEDTADVTMIEGGNFGIGFAEDGTRLEAITDPETVFGYDNSLGCAVVYEQGGITEVEAQTQSDANLVPCCMFAKTLEIASGEKKSIYELIGQVENQKILQDFLGSHELNGAYFAEKKEQCEQLVQELTKDIQTHTGNEDFDAYCAYTYMDNLLRGGYPIPLGHSKIFHVYSRKHGDLERDYNYFSMLPEFFSQGNGNFRDVNQNRRLESFFAPFVGRKNIQTFYSLIQLDGYNPLGVEMTSYTIAPDRARMILEDLPEKKKDEILAFVTRPFTPGKLWELLPDAELFTSLIDFAQETVNGNFLEGYWSDHWDYNLDLIEEYLAVFPEKEVEMLTEKTYTFFLSQININPRVRRYVLTGRGVRQYHALNETSRRNTKEKLVRGAFGKGEIIYTTLLEKLILLCATKFAALDPYGMGIEMEGGKPGWYDALNGLPGIFGSSMAETYELYRMLTYTIGALQKVNAPVQILKELGTFLDELQLINHLENDAIAKQQELLSFWNHINDAKEIYREKTYQGVSGETVTYESQQLIQMLSGWKDTVEAGIIKAKEYGKGICPTYFSYEVRRYEQTGEGIVPLEFAVQSLPHFLEGPTRYLKLKRSREEKKTLAAAVKNSDLYDPELSMYKVNASLQNASYELGRARAFTPGWLENESIWLHMEYKYLLELLHAQLYEEFLEDFYHAAIPFLDERQYGRSIWENSSFIASSKNPNKKLVGKGFVARLSGSTVEFMSMWKTMMFGRRPFIYDGETLKLMFAPVIPGYLVGKDLKVSAMFLGKTKVVYHLSGQHDFYPGNYKIAEIEISYRNGSRMHSRGSIEGDAARMIRDGLAETIAITIKNN